jgi:hypothetical protein
VKALSKALRMLLSGIENLLNKEMLKRNTISAAAITKGWVLLRAIQKLLIGTCHGFLLMRLNLI